MSEKNAYDLGYEAYLIGFSLDGNPFNEDDGRHDEWDDGFSQSEFSDTEHDIGN